jgi:hypothetical protein
VIHIDRVNAHVDIMRSPESGSHADGSAPASTTDRLSTERLRTVVLDVIREHLRDLERRGLL